MILIDTTVWIEYFRQRDIFVEAIRPLLLSQEIITIEPVFSELLYGVRNSRERKIIESYWNILPRIEYGESSMLGAAIFANDNDFYKLEIGLIDAIIIESVQSGNYLLWTLDKKMISHLDQNFIFHFEEKL